MHIDTRMLHSSPRCGCKVPNRKHWAKTPRPTVPGHGWTWHKELRVCCPQHRWRQSCRWWSMAQMPGEVPRNLRASLQHPCLVWKAHLFSKDIEQGFFSESCVSFAHPEHLNLSYTNSMETHIGITCECCDLIWGLAFCLRSHCARPASPLWQAKCSNLGVWCNAPRKEEEKSQET